MTARPRRPHPLTLTAVALVGLGLALAALDPTAATAKTASKKPRSKSRAVKAAPAAPNTPRRVTVTVLHTTDLHGHLLPWDYSTGAPVEDYGLSKIATLVRRVRAEPGAHTLLVDAGDCIEGTALAAVHNAGGPARNPAGDGRPDPQMACMNALGYDAFTVGNHEYNFGLAVLAKAQKEARFPWLSANTMEVAPSGAGAYQAYVVKEVDGVRIGILGLTTPGIPTWEDSANYAGLTFEDPLVTAQHYVPILRGMEHCDAVVLVCHMGLESDGAGRAKPGQAPNENRVLAIARGVAGVDAIVMGHTHVKVDSRIENGVLLTQAGRFGDALGRIDLTFDRNAKGPGYTLSEKKARLLAVDATVASDPEIAAIAAPYHEETEAYLKTVIAQASDSLSGADARVRDNPLLDLIHKAELDAGKADISMSAMFNPRARIAKGPITIRDAFELYPYENTLAVLDVTGQDVKDALEHSAEYYNRYDFGRSTQSATSSDVAGFNFDVAAGVSYRLDVTRPVGERVRDLLWRGRPIDPAKHFKLAINNYRVNGGGGYDMFKGKPALLRTHTQVRDLLIDYIRKTGKVNAKVDGNWRLVPEWIDDPARAPLEFLVRRDAVPADSALAWGPGAPLTRGRYSRWLSAAGASVEDLRTAFAADVGAKQAKKGDIAPASPVSAEQAARWAIATLPAAARKDGNAVRLGVLPNANGAPASARPLTVAEGARIWGDALYPRLTLLETTDFHGAILPGQKDRATDRAVGSSPVLAAWVKAERAKNPAGTLLLDGGDWMQGTPISNLLFGRPVIQLMNRLGVDASAIGNHEFDWSADTLMARMREAKFTPLGANWYVKATGKRVPGVAPWALFEKKGVTVGVIGLLTSDTPKVTMPQNVAQYTFPDAGETAEGLMDSVRAAGADVVVLVGHLPARSDSTGKVSGELADVARDVKGEIAVLGGHSHNRLSGVVDGTPVLISGSLGTTLGRIDLVIDRRTMKAVPEETKRALITTFETDVKPDAMVAAYVDSLNKDIIPITSLVLGQATAGLSRNREAESGLGDWVADVMRRAVSADFAFQNPGGLRADLDAGPVTVGDVYEVMPFDNQIATVTLTGAQIVDVLEHGISPTSILQLSGLTLVCDTARPSGERVLEARLPNGKRIDPGASYKVAVNDFMAQGGDGFTMLAKGRDSALTGILVRNALVEDVRRLTTRKVTLAPPEAGRIVFTPAKAAAATGPGR